MTIWAWLGAQPLHLAHFDFPFSSVKECSTDHCEQLEGRAEEGTALGAVGPRRGPGPSAGPPHAGRAAECPGKPAPSPTAPRTEQWNRLCPKRWPALPARPRTAGSSQPLL